MTTSPSESESTNGSPITYPTGIESITGSPITYPSFAEAAPTSNYPLEIQVKLGGIFNNIFVGWRRFTTRPNQTHNGCPIYESKLLLSSLFIVKIGDQWHLFNNATRCSRYLCHISGPANCTYFSYHSLASSNDLIGSWSNGVVASLQSNYVTTQQFKMISTTTKYLAYGIIAGLIYKYIPREYYISTGYCIRNQ